MITIGLGTITYNPDCTAIIIAAGEAKAGVVADAVQEPESVCVFRPAHCGRSPNARFYITLGAAKQLAPAAGRSRLVRSGDFSDEAGGTSRDRFGVGSAEAAVWTLTEEDAGQDADGSRRPCRASKATVWRTGANGARSSDSPRSSVAAKPVENTRFLHTEPHHDDLMLGYLPYIVRNMRNASERPLFRDADQRFYGRHESLHAGTATGPGTLDRIA